MASVALFAIARKRGEIERKLKRGEGDRRSLRRALRQLEGTAALLREPAQKRPRMRLTRLLLDAIRRERLTTEELTRMICAAHGVPYGDRIRKRVEDALYDARKRGTIRTVGKRYAPLRWAPAR